MESLLKGYRIKRNKCFFNTDFLLVSKYKHYDFGVEEENYVYDSSTNIITKLNSMFLDIVFSDSNYYVYTERIEGSDLVIYKSSNGEDTIVASRINCIRNSKFYILRENKILSVDSCLNIVSESPFEEQSFFYNNQVEYFDDNYSYLEYEIRTNELNDYNLLYINRNNHDVFVHDFVDKSCIGIINVGKIEKKNIIDFLFRYDRCFIITGEKKKFTITEYSNCGQVLSSKEIKGMNPFLYLLNNSIICVYDDLKKWDMKDRKEYPEFETGPSSLIML